METTEIVKQPSKIKFMRSVSGKMGYELTLVGDNVEENISKFREKLKDDLDTLCKSHELNG